MSALVISGRALFMGDRKYSCRANSVVIDFGAEMKDDTTLCDTTRSNKPGLFTVGVAMEGLYDPDEYDAALFASVGVVDVPLSVSAGGTAVGDIAYTVKVNTGSYNIGGPIGDIMPFSLEAQSNSKVVRGVLGINAEAVTASGSAANVNLGAVTSAQTLYASLHVVESGGSGDQTLDVIIESDATTAFSGSEATRLTFAQATTAATSEWVEVSGPITDEYFRVDYTIAGSGSPSFDFFVVFARQ